MLTFILRRLRASTLLLAPYEKLQRRLLKMAFSLFGSADNATRVQAILLVRQMALELPQPALDNCLKVGIAERGSLKGDRSPVGWLGDGGRCRVST